MKHGSTFRLQTGKGGFIRTTLCPVNDRRGTRFGLVDIIMFFSLIAGSVAVARVLLAH